MDSGELDAAEAAVRGGGASYPERVSFFELMAGAILNARSPAPKGEA